MPPSKTDMARCFVSVGACEQVASLLEKTFGPHATADVQEVITALRAGLTRRRVGGVRGRSRYSRLLVESPQTYPVTSWLEYEAVRSGAHTWALRNRCKVATRSTPDRSSVTVYLVQRARA